jgi:hypothetical protein
VSVTLRLTEAEYARVLGLVRHHGDVSLERSVVAALWPPSSTCGVTLASWSCELPPGHVGEHYSRDGLKVWR